MSKCVARVSDANFTLVNSRCANTISCVFPRSLLVICVAAISFPGARAGGAGNDAFADRVLLSGPSASAVSDATLATREAGEPTHAGTYAGNSLWWSWVAPSTGLANFSTLGSNTGFSPIHVASLAVYSGDTLSSLEEIGSTNSATGAFTGISSTTADKGITLSVPVSAGRVYQIAYVGGYGNPGLAILHINRPPTIVSGATASASRGSAFSYQITASEKPGSFSAAGLPAGLSINPFTGRISGTPSEVGVFLVPLEASNSAGAGTATLTLTVGASSPAPPVYPPSFSVGAAVKGIVGVPFSYSLWVTGGPAITSVGALPPGLSYDASGQTIAGVPSVAGVFQVNMSATNSAGAASAVVTLIIAGTLAPPVIASAAAANGTVGASFGYDIYSNDPADSYGASNLPPGLVLNPNSGFISGTPTTSGTYAVPISATNSGGTGTALLTVVITAPSLPAPVLQIKSSATANGVVGTSFTYAVEGGSTANSFTATGLPPGLSLNSQSGYITGFPSTAGVFLSSLTASDGNATVGATVQFTIAATAATAATLSGTVFTSSAGATAIVGNFFTHVLGTNAFSYSATYSAAGLPPGLSIASSTGYITGTPTVAGTYSVSVSSEIPSSGGSPATRASAVVTIRVLSAAPAPTAVPLITSNASASGVMGATFISSILADGSPTSYSAIGLPDGLVVNATTGTITGTPTVAGIFPVTLTATNAIGTGSAALTVTINSAPSAPMITSDLAASGVVGAAFASYTFNSTPTAASYSVGALPPGLSFNISTISGTPTTAGVFAVPIAATNAGGTVNAMLTITIAATRPAPVISSSIAATGVVGSAFSYSISASHSPTSYAATDLPGGLSVNAASGQISGTPTTPVTYAVGISAASSSGIGTGTLTLKIAATGPAPAFSNLAAASATVGTAFSFSLTASSSPTGYGASNLPPGLALNSATGAISGTPTVVGVFSVPISATNAGGTANAMLTVVSARSGSSGSWGRTPAGSFATAICCHSAWLSGGQSSNSPAEAVATRNALMSARFTGRA